MKFEMKSYYALGMFWGYIWKPENSQKVWEVWFQRAGRIRKTENRKCSKIARSRHATCNQLMIRRFFFVMLVSGQFLSFAFWNSQDFPPEASRFQSIPTLNFAVRWHQQWKGPKILARLWLDSRRSWFVWNKSMSDFNSGMKTNKLSYAFDHIAPISMFVETIKLQFCDL